MEKKSNSDPLVPALESVVTEIVRRKLAPKMEALAATTAQATRDNRDDIFETSQVVANEICKEAVQAVIYAANFSLKGSKTLLELLFLYEETKSNIGALNSIRHYLDTIPEEEAEQFPYDHPWVASKLKRLSLEVKELEEQLTVLIEAFSLPPLEDL